ncbi:MAG TPA: hypothetical protein VEC92_03275 [Nitrososphaerales archaeon]|nr:hypothetical protein [Nitrososphaerales archaeon]
MPESSATDAHRAELPPPRPFDKLYWLRIVCGVAAGFFSEYIWKLPGADWTFGITVCVGIYLLSYYAARYIWYRKLEPTKLSKIYTTGIGSYVMLFIFTWILLATLS